MKMQKWKTVKLGDVAPVSASTSEITSDQVWLLNLDAVEPVSGSVLNYVYVAKSGIGSSTAKFDTENVLYSKLRPYLNKVVVPALPGYATSEMLPLKPNRELLQREYLALFLRSPSFLSHISDKVAGAKMPRVVTKDLKESLIPLPPLKEQKRIADILDKAAELISLRKQQIEKLDLLVKSKFIDMFGDPVNGTIWKTVRIEAVCTLKSGSSLSAANENEGGEILYVKVGDMNLLGNEKYITTSSRSVSKKTAGRGIFPVGTVIFPKRGGAIGTNKKRLTKKEICADLNVMGVIPSEVISSEFLHAFFMTVDLGSLDNGSSVPQINNKDIGPLLIPFPPLKLQNEFAAFVEKVEEQKAQMQSGLEKLELNYKALMAECFAGESET